MPSSALSGAQCTSKHIRSSFTGSKNTLGAHFCVTFAVAQPVRWHYPFPMFQFYVKFTSPLFSTHTMHLYPVRQIPSDEKAPSFSSSACSHCLSVYVTRQISGNWTFCNVAQGTDSSIRLHLQPGVGCDLSCLAFAPWQSCWKLQANISFSRQLKTEHFSFLAQFHG